MYMFEIIKEDSVQIVGLQFNNLSFFYLKCDSKEIMIARPYINHSYFCHRYSPRCFDGRLKRLNYLWCLFKYDSAKRKHIKYIKYLQMTNLLKRDYRIWCIFPQAYDTRQRKVKTLIVYAFLSWLNRGLPFNTVRQTYVLVQWTETTNKQKKYEIWKISI